MHPRTLRVATILAAAFWTHTAFAQVTVRVSVKPGGAEARHFSGYSPAPISSDGRWVAFDSRAENITLGDLNGNYDVFVFDRETGATTCVSVTPAGVPGNAASYFPSMAADGRYVVFSSPSTDLAAGDSNGEHDIFLRDLQTATTTMISVDSAGVQGAGSSFVGDISANGLFVAFLSDAPNLIAGDTNGVGDIFVRDLTAGTTERVSLTETGGEADGHSGECAVTPDGRFVAFDSLATNLVSGDANATRDIFVRDRQAGTTVLVSSAPDGTQANGISFGAEISADGRFVCFYSMASTLWPQDTNGAMDVYVRDLLNNSIELVSVGPQGQLGDAGSGNAAMSADGQLIAFTSGARTFLGEPNFDADVFLRDRQAQTTTLISASTAGAKGNDWSTYARISPDGRYVSFKSEATNLINGDWNAEDDVFVRDLGLVSPPVGGYCNSKLNSNGCASRITSTGVPSLSGGSQFFVAASNMIGHKPGTFFWGTAPANVPFGGGKLCVAPPLVRTGIQDSGAVPSIGFCTGSYSFHFSPAYMQQEGLAAGTTLYGQYWGRDPGYVPPNNIALTDGLSFTIIP